MFGRLDNLRALWLFDNPLKDLPEGILDDVLDTLGGEYNVASGTILLGGNPNAGQVPYRGDLSVDSDLKAKLAFASTETEAREGASVRVPVTLSRELPVAVRVPYTVGFGEATGGYTNLSPAPDSGLLFPAGETEGEISLTLSQDAAAQGERHLVLTLGKPAEIRLRRSEGQPPDAPHLQSESLVLRSEDQAVHTMTVSDVDPAEQAPFCLSLWEGSPCSTVAILPHLFMGPLGEHTARTEVAITHRDPEAAHCEVAVLFHRGTSPGSAGSQDGLPNLRPVRPDGWSDSLVVSNRQETHTDNLRLMAYDRLFVDFAVINSGGSPAAASFRIELFLNGRLRETFDVSSPLDPQVYRFREDYPLGRLSSGTHTLRVVVDGGEAVPESDESDNQYTKTFFVSGACFPLTTWVSPRGAGTVIPGREPNCGSATLGVRTPGADDRESNRELGMGGEPVLKARRDRAFDALRAKVRAEGKARVIVGLRTDGQSVSAAVSSLNEAQARSPLISRVQQSLLTRMGSYSLSSVRRFKYMPHLAMEVDGPALEALASDPEDVRVEPSLGTSTALVGAPNAWSQGYSGAGQAVAILDTGVDGEHPFLKDRVVSEACYSGGGEGSAPLCPGGVREAIGMESGEPCSSASDCFHGTAVAGVAAGAGTTFSGVAPDSGIVAIKVFSRCRGPVDCLTSTTSDWVAGLERVLELSGGYDIAAVNMSFGGGLSSEECDSVFPAVKAAMDNLRTFGIAPVASSGNNHSSTGIQFPSCISSVISVGSTDTGADETIQDEVSVFSNNSPLVDLLAPGGGINTSVPGDGFARFDGTSLAVPHVAGAWAVRKSKAPNASVPDLLSALKSTGVPVLDPRNNLIKPRIQVDAALDKIVRELPYSTGTRMTLTARPNPGFRFTGWQGCDSPSGNGCVVEMDSSRQVVALFEPTSAAHPDLVPTSLVTPPIAETGRPVSIYAAVSNPGPVDAGPFRIGFYLSVDDVITTDDAPSRTWGPWSWAPESSTSFRRC